MGKRQHRQFIQHAMTESHAGTMITSGRSRDCPADVWSVAEQSNLKDPDVQASTTNLKGELALAARPATCAIRLLVVSLGLCARPESLIVRFPADPP